MAKSLIELKNYFFPIVDIKANSKHRPDENKGIIFDTEAASMKLEGKGNNYQIVTDIKVSEDSENAPYSVQVQAVGFFTLDNALSKEKLKKILKTRGLENLFAATREIILTISSRGPWGQLDLPIHDPDKIELLEIDPDQMLNTEK